MDPNPSPEAPTDKTTRTTFWKWAPRIICVLGILSGAWQFFTNKETPFSFLSSHLTLNILPWLFLLVVLTCIGLPDRSQTSRQIANAKAFIENNFRIVTMVIVIFLFVLLWGLGLSYKNAWLNGKIAAFNGKPSYAASTDGFETPARVSLEQLKKRYDDCLEKNNRPEDLSLMGREAFLQDKVFKEIALSLFEKARSIDPDSVRRRMAPFYAGALICNGKSTDGENVLSRLIADARNAINSRDRSFGTKQVLGPTRDDLDRLEEMVPKTEVEYVKQRWTELQELIQTVPAE